MRRATREWTNGVAPISAAPGRASIKAEPRYSQADLCGWLAAVLVEWPGCRKWIHAEDVRVLPFELAREASEKLLKSLRARRAWPFNGK